MSDATQSARPIRWLTYLMFLVFAMTTDSVGVIIPAVIREFHVSMSAAAAFQYATMGGIAVAGLLLGHLADKLGRKGAILVGLILFTLNSFLFTIGSSLGAFLLLLFISGAGIGIFKTGALALIGDISRSVREHTTVMNLVEGFFGVGAIIGPAIVIQLLANGVSWRWLYVIAGTVCVALIAIALAVRYPRSTVPAAGSIDLRRTLLMARNPYALGFSLAALLYVATECAVYVWMPTLLQDYHGSSVVLASYAISVFFILRAAGRFVGSWLLTRLDWAAVLALMASCILACFIASALLGVRVAVYVLPLTGIFMSVIYPTLNSKGISCFSRDEHGAAAGVILFFTCAGAALGPLSMGLISDRFGHPRYGFVLATLFAALLAAVLILNWAFGLARAQLARRESSDYALVES